MGELERRMDHETSLSSQKTKKINTLEYELAKTARMQDDLLERERKYGERILELRVQEFASIVRDSGRKKQLAAVIRGEQVVDESKDPLVNENNLHELAEQTLKDVQGQFAGFFQDRQNNIIKVAQQCNKQIKEGQDSAFEYVKVDGMLGHCLHPVSVGSQTDPMKLTHFSEEETKKEKRKTVSGTDFFRKRGSVAVVIEAQIEHDLQHSNRVGAMLSKPVIEAQIEHDLQHSNRV